MCVCRYICIYIYVSIYIYIYIYIERDGEREREIERLNDEYTYGIPPFPWPRSVAGGLLFSLRAREWLEVCPDNPSRLR